MSWFDSLLSGVGDWFSSASAATPDLGTFAQDSLAPAANEFASSASEGYSPDLSSLGWGSLSGGIEGANPATFGGGSGGGSTPFFDPNSVGPPPTVGSVGDTGSSVVGALDSRNPDDSSVADAIRGRANDSYNTNSSTPGVSNPSSPDASIASAPPAPPPTAWESLKQVPGKWWQGAQDFPGKAVESFNRDPFGNSLKLASTAASIGLPLAAAMNQPASASYPSYPSVAPQPLPGTTGTSAADIPAASPMSPNLRSGGFSVGSNVGLKKKV